MQIDIRCDNFLANNRHAYALKATRKKITVVRLRAKNEGDSAVRLHLGSSKLTVGGQTYVVEDPGKIIRQLGEFTWDFLLYSIIDFHPISAIIDASIFLTGPLYNRRLQRQLGLLSNGEMCLSAGESKTCLLAFQCAPKNLERLSLLVATSKDGEQQFECGFESV